MEEKKEALQELSVDEMDQISGGADVETKTQYCKECRKVRVFIVYPGGRAVCAICHKS